MAHSPPIRTVEAPPTFLDGWKARTLVALAFFAGAMAVFAPALPTGTLIDHPDSVLRLPLVSNVRHVPMIFGQEFMAFTDGQYRSLAYALLATVRTFVGADAVLFWHVWLVAFHALNALLVFYVARGFATRAESALVAGGIFLLHPLATIFGNQVDCFHYVLGATFFLGVLCCCLRYARTNRLRWLVAGVLLFVPGLFTSKVLMTLPVMVVLLEWVYRRSPVKTILKRTAPFAALALLYLPLLIWSEPNAFFYHYPKDPSGAGLLSLCSLLRGSWRLGLGLLGGTGIPAPPEEMVPRLHSCMSPIALVSALVVTGLVVAGIWSLRRRQWLGFGLVLMVLAMVPYCSTAVNLVDEFISWDVLYLPLAGFALTVGAVVGIALNSTGDRLSRRALALAAFAPILGYAVLLTASNVKARSAQLYWNAVLNRNPDSQIARLELGKTHLADAVAAFDRYEALIRRAAKHRAQDDASAAEACEASSRQCVKEVRGNEKRAFEHLFSPRLRALAPGSLVLARYYCHLGERLEAAVHMRYCVDALVAQYRTESKALSTLARVMVELGALDYAEDSLGRLLMANPWDTDAMTRLALILADKGFVRAAIRWVEQALRLEPDRRDYRRLLVELRERRHAPADEDASVLEVTPEPADLLRYASAGPVSPAIRDSLIVLSDRRTDDPIIQLEAGIRLAAMGKLDRALEKVSAASDVLQSYAYAWTVRSRIARELGEDDQALLAAYHAARLQPTDANLLMSIRENLGHLLARKGQLDKALTFYGAALKINPRDPQVHYGIGVVRMHRGEYAEAVRHFTTAADLGLRTGGLHHNLGFALQSLGEVDRALEHFRLAVQLNPEEARPRVSLIDALIHVGEYREALEAASKDAERFGKDLDLTARLALLLAAAPDDGLRDGRRAVRLIESALRQTTSPTAQLLDVQAAAYAEVGRYREAVQVADRGARVARDSGNEPAALAIERRRRLYEQRRPFRLSPSASPTP